MVILFVLIQFIKLPFFPRFLGLEMERRNMPRDPKNQKAPIRDKDSGSTSKATQDEHLQKAIATKS